MYLEFIIRNKKNKDEKKQKKNQNEEEERESCTYDFDLILFQFDPFSSTEFSEFKFLMRYTFYSSNYY